MSKEIRLDDALSELEVKLEKARCALDDITQGYFSEPESKHEANGGMMLLYNYSSTSVMASIAEDYLLESQKILAQIQEVQ